MSKSNTIAVFLLLALAIALVYANSLNARFVYDDYAFVYNNDAIRSFRPLSKFLFSPEAFSQPVSYHVYRPLASFTFAVNYALNRLEPSGYHFVNLLFHALNAFLLFFLLKQIGFQPIPSFAGGLIFAIHPVHTEAVTWISGRGNVLFMFFFLLAYLLYVRADSDTGTRRVYLLGGALAAYALSLLSKEMALPLPALFLGHDLYFHREWNSRKWLRRLWLYVPFAALAIAYVLLRAHVLGRIGQVTYHGGSAYATFLAMLRAVVIYARLLLVPVGLSLSRHFQASHSIFDAAVFPSLCLIIMGILAGIISFRYAPRFSFALYWFGVALLPVSNIIPVNAIVADRFLYGPSVGFCILVALLVEHIGGTKHSQRLLANAALFAMVFCFMTLTIGRNNDWKKPVLLWSKTAKSSPTSFVAFNNLGFEYMKLGQMPEAIDAFNEALKVKSDSTEALINLARCYAQLGRVDEAIQHYNAALGHLDKAAKAADARYELGALLERRGSIEAAIAQYEAAVKENPTLLNAQRRLASLYSTRDVKRAIQHYSAILSSAPEDVDACYRLGVLYYNQGNLSSAAEILRRCLSIDPNAKPARILLEQIEEKTHR